jgi:hypothetical protein
MDAAGQRLVTGAVLEPLFTHVSRTALGSLSGMDESTIRSTAVTVSANVLVAGAIQYADAYFLNLFPDVQIVALLVRAERGSRSDTWFGSIKGDKFGRAILTVVDGKLGGLVSHMARHYMVLPGASGLHEVLEVREDSFATALSAGGWRPRSQIGMTSADVDGIIRAMDARAVATNPDTRDIRAMVGDYLSDFNMPGWDDVSGEPVPSLTIQHHLLRYIRGATPGSEIRGHITTISQSKITDALIDAHKRGVTVYLVQDGQGVTDPGSSPEGDRLEAYFGTRHKYCYVERSFIDLNRPDTTSCVSSIDGATHHIKNWMFSNTVVDGLTRRYSTWVTSYNLTNTSDGQFNDAFVVNDNYELYAAYVTSFASFYGQRRSSDFYNVAGRGHHVIPSANTEISYAPQTTSPGHTEYHPTNDHVAMALSRIDGYEPDCSLKVAMLSISSSRWAIIDELVRIRQLGCRVQVAFTEAYGSAVNQLLSAGIEVSKATKVGIHSKMMVYRGRYDGIGGRTFVWGGSHNWTKASIRGRDEVFVAISRLGIFTRYSGFFDVVWARSTPVPRYAVVSDSPE